MTTAEVVALSTKQHKGTSIMSMKQLIEHSKTKTFKVTSEFYITTNQFKSPEELNKFIMEILQSLDGTEYILHIVHLI